MIQIESRETGGFFKIISEDSALRNNAFGDVMKRFAKYMEGSVRRTFLAGGRPEQWQPSKKKKGKTLIKGGRLMKVYSETGNDYILLGSNLTYARIHQYGGEIKKYARSSIKVQNRYTKGKNKGRFKKGTTFGQGFTFKEHSITIPARPYLPEKELLSEDWDWLRNEINDFITKVK